MDPKKFKRILQIVTTIFAVFLVVFFVPVLSSVWSDRNYAPGSHWPAIWTGLGIFVGIVLLIAWVLLWSNTKK